MTRAQMIKRYVAEWFEKNTELIFYEDSGVAEFRDEIGFSSHIVQVDVALLASDLDAEFDRIARETAK